VQRTARNISVKLQKALTSIESAKGPGGYQQQWQLKRQLCSKDYFEKEKLSKRSHLRVFAIN
jgi:hypothetical protein